jgi:hypothetical protein
VYYGISFLVFFYIDLKYHSAKEDFGLADRNEREEDVV